MTRHHGCPPRYIQRVIAADRAGAVYYDPTADEVDSCRFSDGRSGRVDGPLEGVVLQRRSLSFRGSLFAFAVDCRGASQDPSHPTCTTQVQLATLGLDESIASQVTVSGLRASAAITRTAIGPDRSLAWIGCNNRGASPPGSILRACRRSRREHFVLVISQAALRQRFPPPPKLLARGRGIDPGFLRNDGRSVTWRNNGRPRHARIAERNRKLAARGAAQPPALVRKATRNP